MNVTELIARLRGYHDGGVTIYSEAADALEAQARDLVELRGDYTLLSSDFDKLMSRLAAAEEQMKVDRLIVEEARRNEVAAERDAERLAEAERNEETLLGMIRHQRDVLRECLPYINESMAGRRPGRCADDIRAAVKALTADSGSGGEQ